MMRSRRPTLQTIADASGVDASTVSRVLNGSAEDRTRWASAETVARILEVADELDYRRNPHAASLRTARSHLIGIIVPRLQDYVLATVYEGIDEAAGRHGYAAFVANSLDDPDLRERRVRQLLDRRVDGLILCDSVADDQLLDDLAHKGVPFVLAYRSSGGYKGSFADEKLGGELVAEHLTSQGYSDIAVIAGPAYTSTASGRLEGLRNGLSARGIDLPDHRVVRSGFDTTAGHDGIEAILAGFPAPDAVFATNDFAAIGAIGALRERGLNVPDDVAMIGYNDTPLAANLPVPLSTVHSPTAAIGSTAFELIARLLDGHEIETVRHTPTLVARASTHRG